MTARRRLRAVLLDPTAVAVLWSAMTLRLYLPGLAAAWRAMRGR